MIEAPAFTEVLAASAAALGVKSSGSISVAQIERPCDVFRLIRDSTRPMPFKLGPGFREVVNEGVVHVDISTLSRVAELPSQPACQVTT